jgi:hypothetical protein
MDFLRDIKSGMLMMRKNPGIAIAITLIIWNKYRRNHVNLWRL